MKEDIFKLSEKETITLSIIIDNIGITIKYPKQSELKTRFRVIDKLKEIIHKL